MGNWKNRDSKLKQRRTLKQQRKFYETNVSDKQRKSKEVIREQRQEKEDEYDRFLDDVQGDIMEHIFEEPFPEDDWLDGELEEELHPIYMTRN